MAMTCILEYEEAGERMKVSSSSFKAIDELIDRIDPIDFPFLVIEKSLGNYLQIAGTNNELVVEQRNTSDKTFWHYVVGRYEEPRHWVQLRAKIGILTVMNNEVLDAGMVKELVRNYLDDAVNKSKLRLRDITGTFLPT
jgi:hypothetical protein